MEYKQPCSVSVTNVAAYSTRLSNPKVNVTSLAFTYYNGSGVAVTPPFTVSSPPGGAVRSIQIISISLTVKSTEGKYGKQTEIYLNRYVRLWEPEPNANNWVDQNANF